MKNEIITLTKMLVEISNASLNKHEAVKVMEEYEPDFFGEVKPHSDHVKEITDQWKELCVKWIINDKPKYIHLPQIDSTHENINLLAIQSFFKETRSRKFKEMYESVTYVLESILQKLSEQ